MTPRDIGRLAHAQGINSPTLDQTMIDWLDANPGAAKIDQFILWWEGWFEALDQNLSTPLKNSSPKVAALH